MKYLKAILEILELLKRINEHLCIIRNCTRQDRNNRYYVASGHWNSGN